jgi:nucleotide-binding universal stress UspA family protein
MLSLGEYYQARLACLHVVKLWKYPFADYASCEADYANFSRAIQEGGEKRRQEFVTEHSTNGVRSDLVVHKGSGSDCILSFAQAKNVDLIVMGTHGRRGFDWMLLGSTTDRVMRRAACPVHVVSNPSHNVITTGPNGRHRLSRILHCTDFSVSSERALDYAISLAAQYRAELTMVHVAEGAPDLARGEALITTCTQELDRLIPRIKRGNPKLGTAVRIAKPYEEILRYAGQEQISLITMTARGGDALDRAVSGSTTYRVVQLGPCPVLSVHT